MEKMNALNVQNSSLHTRKMVVTSRILLILKQILPYISMTKFSCVMRLHILLP